MRKEIRKEGGNSRWKEGRKGGKEGDKAMRREGRRETKG